MLAKFWVLKKDQVTNSHEACVWCHWNKCLSQCNGLTSWANLSHRFWKLQVKLFFESGSKGLFVLMRSCFYCRYWWSSKFMYADLLVNYYKFVYIQHCIPCNNKFAFASMLIMFVSLCQGKVCHWNFTKREVILTMRKCSELQKKEKFPYSARSENHASLNFFEAKIL